MEEQKAKELVKLLRILSLGLIGTVVFLLLVAVLMISVGGKPLAGYDPQLERTMLFVLLVLSVGGILWGRSVFLKRMNSVKGEVLLTVLDAYRGAMIVRLALVESAAFFGVITYLLLGSITGLIMSVLLLFYMILLHPTNRRLQQESGIDIEELGG